MDELAELLGASPAMESLRADIRRLLRGATGASRSPAVFLMGETGTGKGLVASLLHRKGPRAGHPFVDVNCAAIPETLLESELFGFERGAFTGAQHAKPGLFQVAHTGTIFLDEVGLLGEPLQAKLLKVIEERAVRRLGGTRSEPADVWVISATNSDLRAAIGEHRFREDLYHRLAVVPLSLPPLRARGEDVLLLAEHFLTRICADYGLEPLTLSEDARRCLLGHPWPGNVRELANAVERAALMCDSSRITAAMLDLRKAPTTSPAPAAHARPVAAAGTGSLDEAIRAHLESVLAQHGGNISRTAAALGVARNTLRSQIRRLGLIPTGQGAATRAATDRIAARRGVETGAGGPAESEVSLAEPARPAASPSSAAHELPRWERRRVTVLRTEMLDGESTDDVTPASNLFLASAIEKVQSFGGRVEEVSRNAIEAVFGVEPVDDAARRAALTALAIRMTVARAQRPAAPGVALRVVIHTSAVLIGHAAGTARVDRESKVRMTSILDEVSSIGTRDPIVVTAATAALLGRRFVLEPVGGAPAGGECYRLVGHKTVGLPEGDRLLPFVGRRAELDLLRGRVGDTLTGHGQAVAVVGVAGVGKTRLLRELTQAPDARPFRLLEAGSTFASIGPYRPVVDLLKRCFQIQSDDDIDRMRERVLTSLQTSDASVAALLPAFFALLEVPNTDPSWESLEPAARRQRTFEAVTRLLLYESRVQPVLLLFEDLHWIDTESQALLDFVVQRLAGARMLVLVSYRPEYQHGWGSLGHYTQLRLDSLLAGEARELLDHLLGSDPALEPLRHRLIEWTEGNPFFLEESVRALEETGTLEGGPGAYTLNRPVASFDVPATVEELLAARLDRLAPGDREVLEAAAAIGRDVPLALLAAVAGLEERELRAVLRRLQAAEIMYECSTRAEPEFTFKHVLTHEVAYQGLLPEVRRRLHARILGALEAAIREAAPTLIDRLAYHAFRGEVWDRAGEYLRRSGRRALFASATGEAVEIFDQALVALRHLPQTPERLREALALRLSLRDALWSLGQVGRIRDQLVEAEAIARQLGDPRGLGRVACYLCHYFWAVGELDAAREAGERALTLATTVGDALLVAETELYLGIVFLAQGDGERAAQVLQTTLARLDELVTERPGGANRASAIWLLVRCFLTRSLAALGRFEDGMACSEEAIRRAEQHSAPFGLATALVGLGSLYLRRAEAPAAIPLLERALELCRTYSVNNWLPTIGASLGAAYAVTGRVDEGVRLLEEAVDLGRRMGIVATLSLWQVYLGEAYWRAGRPADALAEGRRALAECRARGERGYEAWALHLLGRIAASQESAGPEEARTHYLLALERAEQLGMRPLVARCVLGLAQLHERAGDVTMTSEYRERAVRLVTELGLPLALLETA